MKSKIKIIQIGAENFGHGGRSVIAYNLVKYMPNSIFQNDFLALKPKEINKYVKHLNREGKVIFVDSKTKYFWINRIRNDLKIVKELKSGKYDVVHIHADNAYEAIRSVLFAKLAGINGIVVHAHVDNVKYFWLKRQIIKLSQKILPLFIDRKIACTKAAGSFLFGDSNKLIILNDGIDINEFKFNKKIREKVRHEFCWDRKIVLGTVARLAPQKNLEFMIKVFNHLKQFPNLILVIIGEGDEKRKLQLLVNTFGLEDRVTFMGNRDDVNQLLQGFDIFILPSIYEGFGISAIEAQAAGLITFVSDGVPKETKMVENIYHRLDLSRGEDYWASAIKQVIYCKDYLVRKDTSSFIKMKGYDIKESSKKLQTIYKELELRKAIK